jgi:hypothetical protein
MPGATVAVTEAAAETVPEWACADARCDEGLSLQLRAVTLFVAAPLGWLLWAGLIFGVKALFF